MIVRVMLTSVIWSVFLPTWGAHDYPFIGMFDRVPSHMSIRKIGFQFSAGHECFQMHVLEHAPIKALKNAIARMFNLPIDAFRIMHGQSELLEGCIFSTLPKCELGIPVVTIVWDNGYRDELFDRE